MTDFKAEEASSVSRESWKHCLNWIWKGSKLMLYLIHANKVCFLSATCERVYQVCFYHPSLYVHGKQTTESDIFTFQLHVWTVPPVLCLKVILLNNLHFIVTCVFVLLIRM